MAQFKQSHEEGEVQDIFKEFNCNLENRMCFRKFIVKQGLTGQIMVNFKNQVSKFGLIYIRRDEFKDF